MRKNSKSRKIRLKLNAYEVVADGVDVGIRGGIQHAFKHNDWGVPDGQMSELRGALQFQIAHDVMVELCERIDFDKSG